MLLNQTQPRSIIQPRPYHQTSSHYPIHHQQFYESADQATANTYDLDIDEDHNNHSSSSSPISTQSLLSQYSGIHSSPLSTFDSIPTVAAARGTNGGSLFDFASQSCQTTLPEHTASLFANSDSMQTDAWHPATGHLTPRSAGRSSHQRESSLSSMGSNGPASPYSQNTSNPYIAVTDSGTDGFHGLPSADDYNYQLVKSSPMITHDTFYTSYPNYTSAADHSAIGTYPRVSAAAPRRKNRGLLPPEAPIGSRPVSVASSITSDSPATPAGEPEERQRNAINTIPKLDRTMTDIYNDELYSPSFTIASAAPTQMTIPSPSNELFAQRLQAANQHLSAVHSPVSASSRDRSPFRHGSPLAPIAMHEFPSPFSTGAQIREQNKALQDARAMQQQMGRSADTSTPQTISPKDAMLEFHEADGDNNFPLFPQQNTGGGYHHDAITKAVAQSQQAFDNMPLDTSAFNNYLSNPQLPQSLQIPQLPQQYPFISQRQQSSVPSLTNGSLAPSRMGSTDTGAADSSHNNSPQRPLSTAADGGTYTCTYHGCTLRFDTPALLQKHKREGHRQAHGLGGSRRAESVGAPGMTSTPLNSQAGPHRCDRINPSTGKPCNTIFSRPYDLTRHEDTIHNARKQKVRCDLCTDEKTFSRADALTRHFRVCHPDVEFPGKQRRRGGHSG